jgi:hypothetical protein
LEKTLPLHICILPPAVTFGKCVVHKHAAGATQRSSGPMISGVPPLPLCHLCCHTDAGSSTLEDVQMALLLQCHALFITSQKPFHLPVPQACPLPKATGLLHTTVATHNEIKSCRHLARGHTLAAATQPICARKTNTLCPQNQHSNTQNMTQLHHVAIGKGRHCSFAA